MYMYITAYSRFLTINCNFEKINYVRHPLSSNVHTYTFFRKIGLVELLKNVYTKLIYLQKW